MTSNKNAAKRIVTKQKNSSTNVSNNATLLNPKNVANSSTPTALQHANLPNKQNIANAQSIPDDQSIRSLTFRKREDLIKAIYIEVLGKVPTYAEIDKFAYKDITPNQIRLELLKSPEHRALVDQAGKHQEDQHTIHMLKDELKQVVWIVKSLQERIQVKADLLEIKKQELKQLRQFIKKLSSEFPEGPSAFFYTIYKTEYTTKIINTTQ